MKIPKTKEEFLEEFYKSFDLYDKIGIQRVNQFIRILPKVSDALIIESFIEIFKNKERKEFELFEQRIIGEVLKDLNLKSNLDIDFILRETVFGWNKSAYEFPFWLKKNYGISALTKAIKDFESTTTCEIEKDKLNTFKYWLRIKD
ncbi:hypothetical protein [Aureivirga marina]|uniref:hypothetical protein n=1 Tax=Aureivirga marina TaxID=1182451 RepID=UPI0018CB7351|nr:hypothetical protein [Aureivirga marina]